MTPETNLKEYTRRGDQSAFGAVVAHFTPLVYGLALQRSGRAELAMEIAQDVFLACARKAPSLVQAGTMLGPWLHRTTLYESMNHLRKEATHHRHVSAAASAVDLPSPSLDAPWMDALPHLDEALNELSEGDRTAVLLRYYSGSSYAEIGNRTGRTEEAARKLCTRAVEKLSTLLRRRGVVMSVTALASGMGTHWSTAQAAVPAALAAQISSHVAAYCALPAAVPAFSILTVMKSSTILTTAAVLALLAIPAAWQWQEAENLKTSMAEARAALERSDGRQKVRAGGRPANSTVAGIPAAPVTDEPLSDEQLRQFTERLVEVYAGDAQGNHDVASVIEMDRMMNQMKTWPAATVRRVLDLLADEGKGGTKRLEAMRGIITAVYAMADPAGSSQLALSIYDRDSAAGNALSWSVTQWFLKDPDGAAAWMTQAESQGLLEGTAVHDFKKEMVLRGRVLGTVLRDPSAAPAVIAATDPAVAQGALRVLINERQSVGGQALTMESLVPLAAAISDPERAGNILGNFMKTDLMRLNTPATIAATMKESLPASLPEAVRRAAMIEGAQVGGEHTAFATLALAFPEDDRADAMAALSAMRWKYAKELPDPDAMKDPDVAPYADDFAAGAALALGSAEFSPDTQDRAAAATWLSRIGNAALREKTSARIR